MLSATPRSSDESGAGIQRRLMDRGVEQARIVLEDVLRAIAVMHVEIDHRDAGDAMDLPRLLGADGDIVEQAEAHRLGGLGVVAGRAGGAEGIARLPRHDGIDRGADGAGGTQRRLAGTGRQDRVVVQFDMPFGRGIAASTRSMYEMGWTRASCSISARGASRRSRKWKASPSSAASTAFSRSGHSGCPMPVSCSMQEGWLKREVYMRLLLFLSVSPRDGGNARPSRLTPHGLPRNQPQECAAWLN